MNSTDPLGFTAVHLAAAGGSLAVLKALLEAGANPLHVNRANMTALDLAAAEGQADALEYILRSGKVPEDELTRARRDGEMTPLVAAAMRNAVKSVRALLRLGADPNACRCPDGRYALHWAAAKGYEEMVELLLAWGANPTARTAAGQSVLDVAASGAVARLVSQIAERPPAAPVLLSFSGAQESQVERDVQASTLAKLLEHAPATAPRLARRRRRKRTASASGGAYSSGAA